jgi:Ca2+-binding RTX toxin-like protein
VDAETDVVTENANEGVDTVFSSVTYSLGNNVENLILTGTAAINGTGNALNNVLIGNSASNTLSGGAGNDTYRFGRGSGVDTVSDYDLKAGNNDVLVFGSGVAINHLWFRRVDSDLEVSIIGTTDKVTVGNWYSGRAYHVEWFKASGGKTLLDTRVEALVSAMAAFVPPAVGQTSLPADYQKALNPVIAANWR